MNFCCVKLIMSKKKDDYTEIGKAGEATKDDKVRPQSHTSRSCCRPPSAAEANFYVMITRTTVTFEYLHLFFLLTLSSGIKYLYQFIYRPSHKTRSEA